MDTYEEIENGLILAVCHLCDRVRELVRSRSTDPVALLPIREAMKLILHTMESLDEVWQAQGAEANASSGVGPEASGVDGNGLLGADFARATDGGGAA